MCRCRRTPTVSRVHTFIDREERLCTSAHRFPPSSAPIFLQMKKPRIRGQGHPFPARKPRAPTALQAPVHELRNHPIVRRNRPTHATLRRLCRGRQCLGRARNAAGRGASREASEPCRSLSGGQSRLSGPALRAKLRAGATAAGVRCSTRCLSSKPPRIAQRTAVFPAEREQRDFVLVLWWGHGWLLWLLRLRGGCGCGVNLVLSMFGRNRRH